MSDGAPPTVTSVTSSGAMAWRKVYDNLFSRYLLLTNTVVSGVLEGLGDFLQQKLEGKQNNDWQRTKRMTIMGLILGPPEHYWFRLLDKRFPGRSPTIVAKKVFLDETVNGVFFLAVFFIGTLYVLILQSIEYEYYYKNYNVTDEINNHCCLCRNE